MKQFDTGFYIGAATAAHQVEGNNTNSDCWACEQMRYTSYKEPSLDAVDHYNRYEEDIKLMAAAGLNAYRFGIEWARIQPTADTFDTEVMQHYKDVIACCKANGLEPVPTLLHFSSPVWLIAKGGWEAESTPADFARYTRYVMEQIGGEVTYVCTINEANMGVQVAALMERFKKQMMARAAAASTDGAVQMGMNLEQMMENQKAAGAENQQVFGTPQPQCFTNPRTPRGDALVMEAHKAARAVMREVCPQVKVGLTLSLHDIQALPGGEQLAAKEWDDEFTHYLPAIAGDDFLGVQNYTRSRFDAQGIMATPEGAELTQMDYEFYPEALENVLRRVAQSYHGTLLVTENGIGTADDTRRVAFIEQALQGVQRCMVDGLPVKGYFHWSLMDNFEWQKGYGMTFGLIAVDRQNGQTRTPKPSLAYLGSWRG